MRKTKKTTKPAERKVKDPTRNLHDFGATAYAAALRFYAGHHRSKRALARYMRGLEAEGA